MMFIMDNFNKNFHSTRICISMDLRQMGSKMSVISDNYRVIYIEAIRFFWHDVVH